jgi:hypothetical protein
MERKSNENEIKKSLILDASYYLCYVTPKNHYNER